MLFNLDKNTKQNLLNEYKQEALNFHQKKKDERQKRIQEEREYIAQREQLEKEADEKIIREKQQRINAQKEEYQSMLMKTKNNIPGYRHNSSMNNQIILNNWGGQEINHRIQNKPQIQNQNQAPINNSNLENNILTQGYAEPETPWRGRRGRGFRNEDHLGNLLNDNRNDQELNKFIEVEKEQKKNAYKDLLYSQFQEANNKNLNLYGTNDPLILERKRKRYLSENPFAKKSNYEFGKSTLSHNPITDPQNNMDYNKYLRFSESNSNINNRNNYNNTNNNQMAQNNFGQNIGNQNVNNNYGNNKRGFDEFKSNNYSPNDMNMNRGGANNNYSPIDSNNQNNFNNNNLNYGINQMGQNQNSGYNNSFRPTPSGERIRQAAASNFF